RSYGPYASVPDRLLRDRDLSISANGLCAVPAAMHADGDTFTSRAVVASRKLGTFAVRAARTEPESSRGVPLARARDAPGPVAGTSRPPHSTRTRPRTFTQVSPCTGQPGMENPTICPRHRRSAIPQVAPCAVDR